MNHRVLQIWKRISMVRFSGVRAGKVGREINSISNSQSGKRSEPPTVYNLIKESVFFGNKKYLLE